MSKKNAVYSLLAIVHDFTVYMYVCIYTRKFKYFNYEKFNLHGDNVTENTSEMLANMTASTTLEEIYPAIAIATLMRIIRDPSLSQHHTMVVQAITFIFKSLGIKCVPYIQQVIPAYLAVIRSADQTFREVRFQSIHFCVR